tara:strand:+ start:4119 stop:4550 length:432 start_codon:yes stop_codon:yes gene_type:complete
MKLEQLRKIIREEVRDAVKTELQEVINEAVKIASTPKVQQVTESKPVKVNKQKDQPKFNTGKASLDEMLQMTKNSMTNEEYKNVFTGTSDMVTGMPNMASSMANQMNMNAGNQPGLDITNLDFVKKAGKVFQASNQKDALKKV